MQVADMRLDGNAVGGLLAELFGADMTGETAVCASCGVHEVVACLEVYVCAPGTVIRCRHCEAVMLRMVEGRDRVWVDVSGVASFEIRR
jgi:Family of unknown function (DUF6510)